MKKGLMTVKSTGAEMVGVFFDKEALEYNRLNMRTKQRLENAQRAKEAKAQHRKNLERFVNAQKAKAAKAQHRENQERLANRTLCNVLLGAAVAAAGIGGLIHPIVWVPFSVSCLCGACVRLGLWFGKAGD